MPHTVLRGQYATGIAKAGDPLDGDALTRQRAAHGTHQWSNVGLLGRPRPPSFLFPRLLPLTMETSVK